MSYEYHYSNFSNGWVVEKASVGTDICNSWLLVPAENLWPKGLRGFLYLIAMMYMFMGIAIASDVFMSSIEWITSTKRTVTYYDEEKGEQVVNFEVALVCSARMTALCFFRSQKKSMFGMKLWLICPSWRWVRPRRKFSWPSLKRPQILEISTMTCKRIPWVSSRSLDRPHSICS